MSEHALQHALQDTLREVLAFANASVVINDWKIMDGSLHEAPYALIETADNFTSRQDAMIPAVDWQIPVTLFVRFLDWQQAYGDMRDIRQAIIDEVAKNENFTTCYLVNTVRSDTPVGEWYDPYMDPAGNPDPVFITQRLILEIEETCCE
jgi:hypothetical protein